MGMGSRVQKGHAVKLTPRNREARETNFSAFIDEFFGIRGLPKVYQADDVYFFYRKQAEKNRIIPFSRSVFIKRLRLCETVDYRAESRRVYFYSVGNEDCPVFTRYILEHEKTAPVILDKKIEEFADYLRNTRPEKYMPRAEVYAMYRNSVSDPIGRNAFYTEMRKIAPEGHGKRRYFCIKKQKIIEK